MPIRFITFLITQIAFVRDCYSIDGPMLRLAAEKVAARLKPSSTAKPIEMVP
jgi:hypothetical protein